MTAGDCGEEGAGQRTEAGQGEGGRLPEATERAEEARVPQVNDANAGVHLGGGGGGGGWGLLETCFFFLCMAAWLTESTK